MKLALVSTFARAVPVLPTWVAVHRAMGVRRFYLFVDDPAELAACEALQLDGVRWIVRDTALQAIWQTLDCWNYQKQFCVQQVYARQCLNTDYAIRLAREDEMDWLIHLDLDERLWLPDGLTDLARYFAGKRAFDVVRFTNHEGVPERWHVGNYLEEVTLFKRNFQILSPQQQTLARNLFGDRYFLAYHNGKAAMNLHGEARESAGVHEFRPASRIHEENHVCVLHYTNCGFNWYFNKYHTLGDYPDYWLDLAEIGKLFPIMEESRQAVVRGSIHDATRLYERQLMHQGGLPHSAAALLQAGILLRTGSSPPQLI